MKLIVAILLLTLLNSCKTVLVPIPLQPLFWKIYKEKNVDDVNDCSNKSGKYLRALDARGIAGKVIVIKTKMGYHAIVKTGGGPYLDPTFGTASYNINDYGKFLFSLELNELDQEFF